jgi:hypothetical protein
MVEQMNLSAGWHCHVKKGELSEIGAALSRIFLIRATRATPLGCVEAPGGI